MPDFDGLQQHKNQLIRKALGGSMFLGDYATVEAITALTEGASSELSALPTGWFDGGLMSDDGMAFTRDVETSDTTSFGEYEPTRSDVSSDQLSVEVSFQETNKTTIQVFTGVSAAALVPDPTTGEIQIKKPSRPAGRFWRALALAVDLSEYGEIYIARSLPRCKVSDYSDQAYAKSDDPITWGVTLQAQKDSVLGYSQNDLFGGPGWKALLEDMGFDAPAGGGGA